jgi:hypothetical protein
MADVVLIHGIAQEQMGKAGLEKDWIPALADGVRAAGRPELANRIWPNSQPDGVDVQMVFYGDLFLKPGSQGEDDSLDELDAEQQALAAALAIEWLTRAAERAGHPDHKKAKRQLAQLNSDGTPMGLPQEAGRKLLAAITKFDWFAYQGMAFAERFVNRSLKQVTKYMSDAEMRTIIQERVAHHLEDDTKVIVGHSLGSVIAYEVAAKRLASRLPLLVTIGSPLGLRSIIYDRLEPQPPIFPALVDRWVNISDRNDLVAAEPDLTRLFGNADMTGSVIESSWSVLNGKDAHKGESYLGKKEVGQPIASALQD